MTTPAASASSSSSSSSRRLARPASLYDEYSLAARGGGGGGGFALTSPALSLHSTHSEATSPAHDRASDVRAAPLHSTFGKFHGEVYESKERSKVLSVLKRRAKASSGDAKSGSLLAPRTAPAKFTADDIVRAGTLTKEGSWRRNWKTRFFILRRDFPCLCYYTSEDKLELLGEIPILPDTMVLDRSAAGHAPFRFQIRSDSKTLLLEAETRDHQRRWVDACQDLVDLVRAEKFRGSTTGLARTSLMDRESSDSRPSNARQSSLVSAAAQQRASASRPAAAKPGAASVVSSATGSSLPLPRSAFSVDSSSVELTSSSVTSTTMSSKGRPTGGIENNPLFTNSSRGLVEDPNFDWAKLLEASSSSSWNEDSDAESDGADYTETSQSTTTTLEPMAEDRLMGSSRGRSESSSKITIVSLNPSKMVQSRKTLFDLSIEVGLGRKSKLMRTDAANEKVGCFMQISGYLKQTKMLVDIGTTDAIKVSTLLGAAAASYPGEKAASVPFSVIISAELEQFAQLRFTLYKCSLSQSPGTAQSCLGIGRCHVTENFLNSIPKTIVLTEKSSTRESLQDALTHKPQQSQQMPSPVVMPEEVEAQTSRGGKALITSSNDGIQIAIRAFPSVAPQQILPTTGIDMANTKYLISTMVPSEDSPTSYAGRLTRSNSSRVLVDSGSFIGTGSDTSGSPSIRYIAVDEILRVPRSTYALPLAYLDYLEEEVLERTRRLRKQLASRNNSSHLQVTMTEFELEHCRKKSEEYMKQRQFLMRQEKRLLDEQEDGKVFETLRTLKKVSSKQKEGGSQPEVVAPFKRSTYKSLDGWQFLPTNMQDQFLCVYQASNQPRDSTPFVWHTMTMGCPAAHTKGFANGGYPHGDMLPEEYNSVASISITGSNYAAPGSANGSNPATSPVSDSPCDEPMTSPMGGPSAAASTQTERTRRKSNAAKTPHATTQDESTASLKTRLELKDRLDIIGSQILSAAVGCIISTLDLAALGSQHHRHQLENSVRFGYLMNFESLLSTQGKEIGMLEDFAAGAKWLRNVFVQFRKHKATGSHFTIKNFSPSDRRTFTSAPANENSATDANSSAAALAAQSRSGHYLLVTIGIQESHMSVLPPPLVAGKPFRMRCVLFTQGVNEKQSLVHAYKASSVKVQDRINRDNLEELKDLYAIYRRLNHHESDHRSQPSTARRRASSVGDLMPGRYSVQALDDLLAQIEHHVRSASNQFKKNVALLTDTSDFCRELGGSRVTCCKSGKDRTAMSVTLEQARICVAELKATHGSTLCASMRLYGVRRKNVFLNTKADKFAFNEVQRKMLPECYKPPAGTYKSGKT